MIGTIIFAFDKTLKWEGELTSGREVAEQITLEGPNSLASEQVLRQGPAQLNRYLYRDEGGTQRRGRSQCQ